MDIERRDQLAIVTGAGGGIGVEIVRRLRREGVRVVAVDLQLGALHDVTDEGVLFVRSDVAQRDEVSSAFAEAVSWGGTVTQLVTCAGTALRELAYDITTEGWNSVLATHLNGTLYWALETGTHMRDHGGGAIVTVGSISGTRGFLGTTAYSVAKAAIHQLTRNLAVEWADDGIRVNCVVPGFVETETLRNATMASGTYLTIGNLHALGRLARPSEIADAVYYLLSEQSSFMTGNLLFVDGGYSAMGRTRVTET